MGANGTRSPQPQAWVVGLVWLVLSIFWAGLPATDVVNQEGRRLTPPTVSGETLYTAGASADAILANTQIFPTNNAWNEDISGLPVAANSATLISANGSGVALAVNDDMPFMIVPPADPLIAITYGAYGSESDPGPYRIPLSSPIEGGSSSTGDRHAFSIDPQNGYLYELYRAFPQSGSWKADASCKWNLNSNAIHGPARTLPSNGWTSCDASGMSVFAGVVRYDECQRGMVEHAIRVTFSRTMNQYIYPATHYAGSSGSDRIRMGERFRLKAGVNISGLPAHAKAIALAMKKYGVICADNGSNWRISNVPDSRFSGLSGLAALHGSDFEVVQTTGATGGPRAAGAGNTCVHAGYAQSIVLPASATLNGAANDPDTSSLIFAWSKTSGPGTVTFSNAAILNGTASFSVAGTYVLQLSAREGTNPAKTATVTITVTGTGGGNQAPVIVSGASASPNPVTNQSVTAVSVSASDPDSGPSALTYTWSKVSGPGTVSFSPNGTTGSSTSTATFSASGTYSLQVSVSDGAAATTSTISGIVVTLPTPPSITTPPANKTVTAGQTATFTVTAAGTGPLSYQWQKGTTNIAGATNSSYTTPATVIGDNGTTYRVQVTNAYGGPVTSSSATLTVNAAGTAPSITTPPANKSVAVGQTATFTVVAAGSPTLTYQWQKGTTNIAGATNSSYTTPATVIGDSGTTYRVQVTNSYGGPVTSSSATLTVGNPPSIVTPPANQTVTAGQTATFTVSAAGSATLTYQWQKGTTNIAGATGSSYTTPVTVVGDSGSTYRVLVSNPFGGPVTSSSATLTVNPAPNLVTINVTVVSLSAQPGSTTVVSRTIHLTNGGGSSVTVTPSTSGGGSWLSTGGAVVIPAGATVNLTITADPTGQTGTLNATLTLTNSPGGQTRTVPVTFTMVASKAKKGGSGCSLNAGSATSELGAVWMWGMLGLVLAALGLSARRQGAR